MITISIFIVIAYLCGSLSSAIIVCKLMGLPDPRTKGSGNPGTSNVLRIGGKKAAIAVLLGDAIKGYVPVLLAYFFNIDGFALAVVALAAVLGHIFPVFFNFKGGKGVATFFGISFALAPTVGLAMGVTWLIMAFLFRYSSLASLTATALSVVYIIILSNIFYIPPVLAIIALIIWKHRNNIKRLQSGTERKIRLSKRL